MSALLDEPVIGGGIRSVNFFNGRLLTGEDLTREQTANRLRDLRLGRALGSGVATGLEVTAAASSTDARPMVRVEAGLAVDRRGRVLELPAPEVVSLTRDVPDGGGTQAVFADCVPLQPGTYSAGAGVYLFTVAAAEVGEGRAAVSGLGNEDAGCNVAFSVEGVRFGLLRLALPPEVTAEPARLRSRLAHLLLGTADRAAFSADPFGPVATGYGLLDQLRGLGCLGDEHVPLAVLAWSAAEGLQFVDLWAARRRIVAPSPAGRWPALISDRRRAEAEATFLQFQEQVAWLMARGEARANVTAAQRFAQLPPAGVVPVTPGFDANAFLGAQGSDELATLDPPLLRPLLEESLDHEPVAVGGEVTLQRYRLRGNAAVMVFAREELRYRASARYGESRYGGARYGTAR